MYIALIGYIHYELPPEDQNFATLIGMLNKMDVREDDEDYRNEIDEKFEKLAKDKPEHFAVRQYAKYRLAAGMTLCIGHLTHAIMSEMITIRKELTIHEDPHHYCLVRTPQP